MSDTRTRAGRELEVLQQVKRAKGFSIFWACDTPQRANAVQRLCDAGVIVRVRRGLFPWCPYRLTREGHRRLRIASCQK